MFASAKKENQTNHYKKIRSTNYFSQLHSLRSVVRQILPAAKLWEIDDDTGIANLRKFRSDQDEAEDGTPIAASCLAKIQSRFTYTSTN